jgi:hypothetical protein
MNFLRRRNFILGEGVEGNDLVVEILGSLKKLEEEVLLHYQIEGS